MTNDELYEAYRAPLDLLVAEADADAKTIRLAAGKQFALDEMNSALDALKNAVFALVDAPPNRRKSLRAKVDAAKVRYTMTRFICHLNGAI